MPELVVAPPVTGDCKSMGLSPDINQVAAIAENGKFQSGGLNR